MRSSSMRLLLQKRWIRQVAFSILQCPAHSRIQYRLPRQVLQYSSTSSSPTEKSSLPSYKYTSLNGSRQIRLLEIPAIVDNNGAATLTPIICRLITVSLDDNPHYHALSYSWDDQIPDRILHLRDEKDENPTALLVTENCDDAIRALQKNMCQGSPLRIWIDAISINQVDVQEKNSQVPMMGDIYRRAFVVHIWLGLATDDSYAAAIGLLGFLRPKKPTWDEKTLSVLKKSITSLGNRRYWQRIWTLQEVALAKVVLVHIGDERLHYWSLANGSHETGQSENFFQMGIHFIFSEKMKHELENHSVSQQIATLMMAQSKTASDPRDKIYAVRSLLPNMFKDIIVDYGKPVQQVFAEGTRAVIEHNKSLEVLLFQSTTDLSAAMPSWSLDWSNTDHLTNTLLRLLTPRETSMSPARITFSNNSRVLSLYGRVIDTVEHVDWPLSRKFDYKLARDSMGTSNYLTSLEGTMDIVTLRRWISAANRTSRSHPTRESIAQFINVLDPNSAGNDELETWLQVIASGIPLVGWSMETLNADWQNKLPGWEDRLRKALFPAYKGPLIELPVQTKILMNIMLDMIRDKKLVMEHMNIIQLLGGQTFFVTSQGCMGIGDPHMKKGDQIMVFEGAFFPMIVRSDGMKNIIIGSARVSSWDVDALLEDKHLLEMIQIS